MFYGVIIILLLVVNIYGKCCNYFPLKAIVFFHHNVIHRFLDIPPFFINFSHPLGLTVFMQIARNVVIRSGMAKTRATVRKLKRVKNEAVQVRDILAVTIFSTTRCSI